MVIILIGNLERNFNEGIDCADEENIRVVNFEIVMIPHVSERSQKDEVSYLGTFQANHNEQNCLLILI